MRTTALTLLTATATTAALALAPAASAAHEELDAAGLAAGGTKVTTFALADGAAAKAVRLTGLDGDRSLVGIDYRVIDGLLYGVGDAGGLYQVDPESGATEKVGRLTVALDGTAFGVDFNPAANALRVISDTGQNLRQSFAALFDGSPETPQAATLVDGPLNYGGAPASATTSTGGTPATGVTGAGYENNDTDGTTGTRLFDIDTTRDVLALADANRGILTEQGALGVDASEVAGFDIYTSEAGGNTALALLTVDGQRGLYVVNLGTGAARLLTDVTRGVSDLAVMP